MHALLALTINEALAQGAAYLVAENQPAQGRRHHQVAAAVPAALRQRPAQLPGDVRVLSQVRALQKKVRVPAALHQKMSLIQRPGPAHEFPRLFLRHGICAPFSVTSCMFMIPVEGAPVKISLAFPQWGVENCG